MNHNKPKISVIMSTYNRKQFLLRSISSILKQTFSDFELILVNNGSTDGSDKICRDFSQKDHRIKLINIRENQGASSGRNKGLDEAIGHYITFIDDDDYCEPEMLQFLWELVDKHNANISICGSWYELKGDKKPKYIFKEKMILSKLKGLDELLKREKYNVAPPTKLFKRELFENIRFPSQVLVDDIHVIYKAFVKANTIVAKGTPLYSFTKHGGNMTGFIQSNNLSEGLLKEYLEMYSERTRYLSERVPEIKERAKYSEWSYMISMCNKIIEYNCSDCMEIYYFMIGLIKESFEEIISSKYITKQEKELLKILLNLQ